MADSLVAISLLATDDSQCCGGANYYNRDEKHKQSGRGAAGLRLHQTDDDERY